MIRKRDIHKAYRFLREKNHDIPDEVLDFMKDSSLAALNEGEENTLNGMEGVEYGR
jgi:pyruvate-formate lyase-activating enzyme